MSTITSRATGMRVSPRKVGEVAALIRGRTVEEALTILEHTPRRAAQPLSKAVKSAAANAENNHKMVRSSLKLEEISVGTGFALKRFRPAAHGRALPYKRQSSNVEIKIAGDVRKPKAKSSTNKAKTPAKATASKEEAK